LQQRRLFKRNNCW